MCISNTSARSAGYILSGEKKLAVDGHGVLREIIAGALKHIGRMSSASLNCMVGGIFIQWAENRKLHAYLCYDISSFYQFFLAIYSVR